MPALIAQPGMPIWVDLATTDLDAAKAFYAGVLGWEFQQVSPMYALAKKDGMSVAGVAQVPKDNVSLWGMMLYTPNVADAHAKALEAGATSVLEPQDIKDGSSMAMIVDPCGATVGLKRPADEIALFAAGEPSTPVWHELLVGAEWDKTLEFYHTLAGWDIRAMGGGSNGDAGASDSDADASSRYAVGEYDGAALVGMWDTSRMLTPDTLNTDATSAAGVPEATDASTVSMWTLYMGVGNLSEAIGKALELGGTLVREPWLSEFGRMATIQDAQGALLNLCEVEEYVPSEDEVHEPDLFAPEDFRAN
ncbi:VOC family protein [Corynebacterium sp. 320]|uniref:VOC family protein n=1 Tax=Corynebacterium TaxID=1716 RepID=UPI00125CCB98|nr:MULTISPECIES: VOC family protein [Corynebacterium]KAB1502708.1 VOC family protein [Corynebacterium sp. 320]KAB1550554.1 VOC family protein [Corynebacterium sp. 319]KAB1554719.1 VOC family protein [Corynebacterium sp. 321]KAB3526371.1 VOC family protein [Corynebacterium sp. 250]KAB3537784.1 VOC family protein [Corynebacterium sp. 366]